MGNRKAKPSETDKAAAQRLRAAWDARARGLGLTQDKMAAKMDGSQGLVSQYLNGLIPLNYRALLAFSDALGVQPETIRTDLPEQVLASASASRNSQSARLDPEKLGDAMDFLDELDSVLGRAPSPRPNPFRLAIAYEVVAEGEIVGGQSVVVRLADKLREWEIKRGNESGATAGTGAADGSAHGSGKAKTAASSGRG